MINPKVVVGLLNVMMIKKIPNPIILCLFWSIALPLIWIDEMNDMLSNFDKGCTLCRERWGMLYIYTKWIKRSTIMMKKIRRTIIILQHIHHWSELIPIAISEEIVDIKLLICWIRNWRWNDTTWRATAILIITIIIGIPFLMMMMMIVVEVIVWIKK